MRFNPIKTYQRYRREKFDLRAGASPVSFPVVPGHPVPNEAKKNWKSGYLNIF